MTIDEAIEKSKELASTYRIAAKNAENIFISKSDGLKGLEEILENICEI